jgi:hypothetical protein
MANFAVMSGDVVSNVIVADLVNDAELATGSECIRYDDANPAGIGWSYDRILNVFLAPKVGL